MSKNEKLPNDIKVIIKSYVSNLLHGQVQFLENQIEGLMYDEEIEFLHHTRVISRRILNTLTVFSSVIGKKNSIRWVNSIKEFSKSLTKIRDLDVQIRFLEEEISSVSEQKYLAGLQRIHLRKVQRRERKQNVIRESILSFEKKGVVPEINEFIEQNPMDTETFIAPDYLKQVAFETIEKLIKDCFSYVPFITNPNQSEYLHGLRLSIKNLRYSVELFQPIYPILDNYLETFKKFQDDLGQIHDYDVWLIDLEKFMESEKKRIINFYGQSGPYNFIKPGVLYLMDDINNRKIENHERFLEKWNFQFQNQFWTNLQSVFDISQNNQL